jgi:hypothetical protein
VSERLSPPDPVRIAATQPQRHELLTLRTGTRLVRLHYLGGAHPSGWNEFRTWGPTLARFDHHPGPEGDHPNFGILYASRGHEALNTVLAECFSHGGETVGPIERSRDQPTLSAFTIVGPVRVLRLESSWTTRSGGNQAICSGARAQARAWAREIHVAFPRIDGLLYPSSIWGPGACLALWERAARAMPSRPDVTRVLDDPIMGVPLAAAAEELKSLLLP